MIGQLHMNWPSQTESVRGKPWWRETEAAWLLVLVVTAYFIRAGAAPIQGEEPTRAQIAFEMALRGDWIVPREQGEPFLIRPPFQNWMIAASCLALKSWDAWAVRFPSLVSVLLTTLILYGYSRTFLSRLGAFAAGAAFATFGHMFTKGCQAETDALFIFLVTGSLLIWHWGLVRRWPDWLTFSLGYGLMALGMLTKGLQAPVYFAGAIGAYLVLTGQWRRLFSRGHLTGILVAVAILLVWMVPLFLQVGLPGVREAWLGDGAMSSNGSLRNWDLLSMACHLVTYPLETLGALLPWSLFLLLYLGRGFRQAIGAGRPQVLFIAISLAVAFPTCWIPPNTLTRYFAPLYPCLAVLIGAAIQRCAEADATSWLPALWRWHQLLMAACMVLSAVAVLAVSVFGAHQPLTAPWAEPPLVALAYTVVLAALAVLVYRIRADMDPQRMRLAVLATAVALAIAFMGVLMDGRLRLSVDAGAEVRQVKERLPAHQPLVSLGGRMDCLFPYHYGRPIIASRPWPERADSKDVDYTYFCVTCFDGKQPELPFPWETVGVVSLDRFRKPVPNKEVIVGRRLTAAHDSAGVGQTNVAQSQ
jgi:4-amino-4-deoxy-L-arabinose transferase-like glycosyltransferase